MFISFSKKAYAKSDEQRVNFLKDDIEDEIVSFPLIFYKD